MKCDLEKKFNRKKVFITGDTGFKGSWLSIWLRELGADVLGYSLEPSSRPSNFEAAKLSKKINHIYGDVRDFSNLKKVFAGFQPDIVFHLAAQPLVRRSFEEPQTTFETNIMGTVNICELVRNSPKVRAFINVTSDKCYENKEWDWGYRENDALGGGDPYSASKSCSELVTRSYIKSFFTQRKNTGIATARAGNVIGGGDWGTDRLFPDCIRALSKNGSISIRNLKSIRPWQFVLEPLYGYLRLASKLLDEPGKYSGAWNFGPDWKSCITVGELTEKIVRYWGSGGWKDVSGKSTDNKYEMGILKLNCDKANSLLGWQTLLDIDSAVKMTVGWYKTFYRTTAPDMYSRCVAQIKEYCKIAGI